MSSKRPDSKSIGASGRKRRGPSAKSTQKSAGAFRTISEVSTALNVPQHVLRFWESKFSQVRPMKRAGGRRYYRPEDVRLLFGIREFLYEDGYTIRGVQKLLRERGGRALSERADLKKKTAKAQWRDADWFWASNASWVFLARRGTTTCTWRTFARVGRDQPSSRIATWKELVRVSDLKMGVCSYY